MGTAASYLPTSRGGRRGRDDGLGLLDPPRTYWPRQSGEKICPGNAGTWGRQPKRRSQPIEDLIGPEPLQALQRLVERREFLASDSADLGHGGHVLLVKRIDDVAHLAPFVGELDAHRTAVDTRALMIEVSHLHQLLEVVGHVGAEIIAPRAQLAGGKILLADVVQEQRLHRIDIGAAPAIELNSV